MAMDPTQPTAPTNNPAQPAQVKPPMTPPGGMTPPTNFTPPQTPTSVPTLGPATTQAGTTTMTPGGGPVDDPANRGMGQAPAQPSGQAASGTGQLLAGLAGSATSDNGKLNTAGLALPPTTADNWQGADARIAGQQTASEQASHAAGLSDMKTGYNPWESQAELNARRGVTLNPANGSFDDPNTRAAGNTGPSTYSYAPGASGGQNVLQSQSLNGGPTTDALGKPLGAGVNNYGETQQMGGGLAAQLKNPDGTPLANQANGSNQTPEQAALARAATPVPGAVPSLGPAQSAATSPTGGPAGTPTGVGISGINPGQPGGDLRGSQILPTDQVDRFKLAQDRFDTMSKASDPAYQASLRSATQRGAASGTMGSGMLNTDYGNLALQRGRDLETSKSNLLQNALEGSIGDSANNRAEYRGERGYQNALENQGYNRGVNALDQEDRLTNSAYRRSSGNYEAGQQNNPANQYNLMANIYGGNASAAGAAAGQYAQARATNKAMQGMQQHPLTSAIYPPQPTAVPGDG